MTLLEKTYHILNQPDRHKTYLFRPQRPVSDCRFNSFYIPKSRQYNKQKELLSKILAFIDSVKSIRFSEGVTIMPVSVTNRRLLSIFGSEMQISRAIQYMKGIGLLADYNTMYFYHSIKRSRTYAYSKETEDKFKEYCKENNINIYSRKRKKNHIIVKSFPRSSVRFSSKLHLMKPDNLSVQEFEDFLSVCLCTNYPQLAHYQNIADEINNTYYKDYPDLQISFRPKFTWSKGNKAVRKIGIRATNRLVSVKNEHEENDENWIMYKDEVLKKYNLKYSYDVPSSVPRITYLLNHKKWLSDEVDLYKVMYDLFIQKAPEEALTWNKKNRDIFKSFHMAAYFDKASTLAGHIKRRISFKSEYKSSEWFSLDGVMTQYKKSVEQALGYKLYDSEVFFHESCIYMDVLKTLLDKGYFIWQQYDGFYSDKPVENIQEVITEIAEDYVKEPHTKQIAKINNRKEIINENKLYNISLVNIFDEQWLNC